MKKLLSILGAVSLTATGASDVVACKKTKEKNKKEEKNKQDNNLPNQDEILKHKKIQEDFLASKPTFLGNLSISPPEKIIVKNPKKVSYEELVKNLDKTLENAAKIINKSLTKNDITINYLACNSSEHPINFEQENNFDLSLPRIARINIISNNNSSNSLLFSILLPVATFE